MKKLLVSFYSLLMLVIAAIWLSGCGSPATVAEEEITREPEKTAEDFEFDPLGFPGDTEIIPLRNPVAGSVVGRQSLVNSDESSPYEDDSLQAFERPPEVVDTVNNQAFRVQIFTSKLFSEAKQAVVIAEEIFDRPVFIDYEVPYFKVRVGNLETREKAEAYQQKARAVGYPNAWVVVVTRNIREVPGLYDDLPDLLILPDSLPPDSAIYDDEEN